MDYRIFVEKKSGFRVEAESLQRELNANLGLTLNDMRLVNVYDLFDFTPELLDKTRYGVFGEVVTDSVFDALDLEGRSYIAIESLPGQFDQRAASAVDCVKLEYWTEAFFPPMKMNPPSFAILILNLPWETKALSPAI